MVTRIVNEIDQQLLQTLEAVHPASGSLDYQRWTSKIDLLQSQHLGMYTIVLCKLIWPLQTQSSQELAFPSNWYRYLRQIDFGIWLKFEPSEKTVQLQASRGAIR